MNHLDEGTIHAWLDGALSAAESRDIEAHVAGCATCAAAVAEARGLIAGASRILGALDDVPGGVIPRAAGAPVTIAAASATAAGRPKGRGRWRVTRWAGGIAAVLVGAAVLSTAHQADRAMQSVESIGQPMAASGMEAGVDSTTAPAPAPAPATEQAVLRTNAAANQPVAPRSTASASAADQGANAAAGRTGTVAEAAPTKVLAVEGRVQEKLAPQRAAAPAVGAAAGAALADIARMDTMRMRLRRAEQAYSTEARQSRLAAITDVPVMTAVERLAGCYRIEAPQAAPIQAMPPASTDAASRRRGSAAPAPAPSPAAERSRFANVRSPSIIRLDTAQAALGYAVVGQVNDTVGSWRLLRDSARVDLGTRGVFIFNAAHKVACPER